MPDRDLLRLDSPEKFIRTLVDSDLPAHYSGIREWIGTPVRATTHVPEFNPNDRKGVTDPATFWIWRELVRAYTRAPLCPGAESWEDRILNITGELPRNKTRGPVYAAANLASVFVNDTEAQHHFFPVVSPDSSMISIIPTAEYGIRDRRVELTFGKFLTRYYGHLLAAHDIRDFEQIFRATYSCDDVKFGQTSEEWLRVYVDGPNSCMSKPLNELRSHIHPVLAYANLPHLRVAYLERNGSVSARTVVWEDPAQSKKCFIRVFGDKTLASKLQRLGYKVGNLRGATINMIPAVKQALPPLDAKVMPNTYVVPYLDDVTGEGAQMVYIDPENPEFFTIGAVQDIPKEMTFFQATSAHGLIGLHAEVCMHTLNRQAPRVLTDDDEDAQACAYCDDLYDPDDLLYTGDYHDEVVCQDCRVDHYTRAYSMGTNNFVRHGVVPTLVCRGARYVDEEENLEHYRLRRLDETFYIPGHAEQVDRSVHDYRERVIRSEDARIADGEVYHHSMVAGVPTAPGALIPTVCTEFGVEHARFVMSADGERAVFVSDPRLPSIRYQELFQRLYVVPSNLTQRDLENVATFANKLALYRHEQTRNRREAPIQSEFGGGHFANVWIDQIIGVAGVEHCTPGMEEFYTDFLRQALETARQNHPAGVGLERAA